MAGRRPQAKLEKVPTRMEPEVKLWISATVRLRDS